MSFERQIDGAIGRMLSWLVQPPVRAAAAPRSPGAVGETAKLEPAASTAERGSNVATEAAEALAESVDAALEKVVAGTKEKPLQAPRVVLKTAGQAIETLSGQAAEPSAASSQLTDELTAKILAALAAAENGLAMKGLVEATGAPRSTLRLRLSQLIAEGRILRKGEGMRSTYQALGAS
ncbi:MAG: hypothetical protein AAF657_11885 [Acidobacteriota bacterium]